MGATNVNEVSMGTNGAAITDWDKVLDLLQLLREDNAEEPSAMIMNPRTSITIAKFKQATENPVRTP